MKKIALCIGILSIVSCSTPQINRAPNQVTGGVSSVAATNPNEISIRQVLRTILSKADLAQMTRFYYQGKTKNKKSCQVDLISELKDHLEANKINSNSRLQASIAMIGSDDFWIRFDGEGPPEKFYGKPVQSFKKGESEITLYSDDTDISQQELNQHWMMNLKFSGSMNLASLKSVSASIKKGDKTTSAECGNLKLIAAINSATYNKIIKAINNKLGSSHKVEIFNGCSVRNEVNIVATCGFAIDEENDRQGSAHVQINKDGSVSILKLSQPK